MAGATYYYISPSNDPLYNVALEAFLYHEMRHLDRIYMLWVNTPSVFMGKYQAAIAETNQAYLEQKQIPLIRRNSGGGTVYHDLGNLNYTCIANDLTGQGHNLADFPTPIQSFASKRGVELVRSPRGDLRYNGYKVGGAAEALRSGRMLYHMSLLFDADLGALEQAITPRGDIDVSSRVPSVRSQVCNLREPLALEDMDAFRQGIIQELELKHGKLLPLELPQEVEVYIPQAIKEKFGNPLWTYDTRYERRVNKSTT